MKVSSTPYYNSIDEMLVEEKDLDVVVASPNWLHAEHSLKCLEAKKRVFVEKPMTLTKADAEKVIFKALNAHKQLFVVMQNRYSPPNIWLKELIESGRVGRIFVWFKSIATGIVMSATIQVLIGMGPKIWMEEPCLHSSHIL